jgi:hypothetical protein
MSDTLPLDRKSITFEQAEGADPLPSQLQLKTVSPELRSRMWELIHKYLENATYWAGNGYQLRDPWAKILYNKHVHRDFKMADEFKNDARVLIPGIKTIFVSGDYIEFFGFMQWLFRHPSCPTNLSKQVDYVLVDSRASYRVVDGNTITPFGSDNEIIALQKAFEDVSIASFHGAKAHLRSAASALSMGKFADSVRESIHAVESTAKVLEPDQDLSKALARIEKSIGMHNAMKRGFAALYGYTSNEEGIRHPLLENGDAKVDETDALFMLGACASFVSYLINKAKKAGLETA